MDKDTILNYVTETPGNTNRAVLGSMLDDVGVAESDVLFVCITTDSSGYVADKTYDEIKTAYESGKVVILKSGFVNEMLVPGIGNTSFRSLNEVEISSTGASDTIYARSFTIDNQNNITPQIGVATVKKDGALIVNVRANSGESPTADHTIDEIRTAIKSGKAVYVYISNYGYFAHLTNAQYPDFKNAGWISFQAVYGEDQEVFAVEAKFMADGTITITRP